MQLSKVGGGVSVNLTNLRAKGEDIGIPNVSKGVVGLQNLITTSVMQTKWVNVQELVLFI